MTGAERVLAELRSGPKTQAELYASTHAMVHSRVSDLRRKGFVIECDKTADYTYRLLSEPETIGSPSPGVPPRSGSPNRMRGEPVTDGSVNDGDEGAHASESPRQLSLITPGAYHEAA